jgi:hypothetical protein
MSYNEDVVANLAQMLDRNDETTPLASTGRVHFMWTDLAMKLLINSAYKQEAYKKTSVNMEVKWEMVKAELKGHETFRNWPDVTAKNLRQKFNRYKDDVTKRYALEQEGANLSGLAEQVNDCDAMMVGILQELAELKDERDENKEKACKNQVFIYVIYTIYIYSIYIINTDLIYTYIYLYIHLYTLIYTYIYLYILIYTYI